jgi:Tfp pilus assembly protein FimT
MMKHCALAFIAMAMLALLSDAVSAQGKWKAAAASSSDEVYFAWGESRSEALSNALQTCKAVRGNECRTAREKLIAVESRWWLVVAECNGKKFVGGSQWNADVALENARSKVPAHLREACFYNQELSGTVPPVYQGQGDTSATEVTRVPPRRVICWSC